MKERNYIYSVKMNPHFLFNTFEIFNSYFTSWMYLYIKLDKNMLIEKENHNLFKIKMNELSDFFMINRATTYRAIKELIKYGLLEKVGNKYRIFDEEPFIERLKPEINTNPEIQQISNENELVDFHEKINTDTKVLNKTLEKFPQFIMINQLEFLNLRYKVLNSDINYKDYPRTVIKIIEMYYFLTAKNNHCLLNNNKFVEILDSEETQTSITRKLSHDNRFTKGMLDMLHLIDYIELDKDGSIRTVRKIMNGFNAKELYLEINSKNDRLKNKSEGFQKDMPLDDVKQYEFSDSEINQAEENFDSIPNESIDIASSYSADKNNLVDINLNSKKSKSEIRNVKPVPVQERLEYIYMTSKNDTEIFEQKAMNQGIAFEEIQLWLKNNNMAA